MTEAGAPQGLRRSPLDAVHRRSGAKLVEFGGWDMPVSYPLGTLDEHRACRTAAALFDVSHLGTVRVTGPGGFAALQGAFTNDLARIGPGRAQYTHLLDPDDASVVDDLIIWWRPDDSFDVMPNASNTARVVAAILAAGDPHSCSAADVTSSRAVLALQGPTARAVLGTVSPDAAAVGRFRVAQATVSGVEVMVAGTGYTGEDGVELAVPVAAAAGVWQALVDAGAVPAGLGARDTLRLESALPLHGHELGAGITSDDAGLSWVVRADKGPFRGRAALLATRATGGRHRLRGIATEGRRPPRDGSAVLTADGVAVGKVSSGNFSPTLGHGIALAFLGDLHATPLPDGTPVEVDVRGRSIAGRLVEVPFYRRGGEGNA